MLRTVLTRKHTPILSEKDPHPVVCRLYSVQCDVIAYAECNTCQAKEVFSGESYEEVYSNMREDSWIIDTAGCDCWCPEHGPRANKKHTHKDSE